MYVSHPSLSVSWADEMTPAKLWGCLSTLTLSRMTLSKVSFSDILRNDYLDHFDTFGENFDFDTFKNDTFESVWVDRHPHTSKLS